MVERYCDDAMLEAATCADQLQESGYMAGACWRLERSTKTCLSRSRVFQRRRAAVTPLRCERLMASQRDLDRIDRHIAEAEERIHRQTELVEELRRDHPGIVAEEAQQLLSITIGRYGRTTRPPQRANCNDSAVCCNHSDRLILEETQHGPLHRRLPVRQRPNRGVGTPIPGRPLSLSRLPQASWGPFSRFRGVPSGCGDDRWRNTRLRRAVFLSPLRLLRFRTHRRRNRSEPRIPGCP